VAGRRRHRDLLSRGLSPSSCVASTNDPFRGTGALPFAGMIASNSAALATPLGLTRSTITAPAAKNVQGLMTATAGADPVLGAAIALGAVTGQGEGELRAAVRAAGEQSVGTRCCRLTLWAPSLSGGNLADGAWRLTSLAWARQPSLSAMQTGSGRAGTDRSTA
jgi:hypothetical protein